MITIRTGLGAALIAGLFTVGCGNRGPPPATGIESIQLDTPNPYGEIPYDRNLVVNKYSADNLKDIHTLRTGDVIATLYVTFTRGSDTEAYEIEVTKESKDDAQILANNLSRYNVVRIPPVDFDPRGSRTDGTRVMPTEHGLVYRVPASELRFSDLETYDVKTKQAEKAGSIDNNGVNRPWLPESQRLEKPCIADEAYRSICGTSQPQTASAPARPAPQKPPAPVKPANPNPATKATAKPSSAKPSTIVPVPATTAQAQTSSIEFHSQYDTNLCDSQDRGYMTAYLNALFGSLGHVKGVPNERPYSAFEGKTPVIVIRDRNNKSVASINSVQYAGPSTTEELRNAAYASVSGLDPQMEKAKEQLQVVPGTHNCIEKARQPRQR